jgi:very-short-patch-repair endonuclease
MKKPKRYPRILKARELRKESTEAEKKLWKYLRDRRFLNNKFRRQHIIDRFIVDFYCPEAKLAIELDGSIHLQQKDYDLLRQNAIENAGIKILRFKNREVLNDIKNVLISIKNHLPHPSPLKMEKGACQKPKAEVNLG